MTNLNVAQRWADNIPELKHQHREVAERNMSALRAAASHFALGTVVSNHRQLGLEVQTFFELRIRTMLKTMNFIIATIDSGIVKYTGEKGEPLERSISLSDLRDFEQAQADMTRELTKTLGLTHGNIDMKDLLFAERPLEPASGGGPQVHINNAWSGPVEARGVSSSRVEVLGEVVGGKT